jgi:hypothetical protein
MLGDRWGVTDAEVARRYACDDLLAKPPTLEAWRGVTIDAPPSDVWRWLVQVRLAPYSYDWIDNGGRRSPRTLMELDDPAPGDPFSATVGRPLGRILSVDRHVQLTATILGTLLTYQLDPVDATSTRLILKIVGRGSRIGGQLLCLGDLIMARRQLLNFKELAEQAA